MTGLPTVIDSADPSTSEPVTVHVDGAASTWDPATPWCTSAGRAAHAVSSRRSSRPRSRSCASGVAGATQCLDRAHWLDNTNG
jgi:hypothetical protein